MSRCFFCAIKRSVRCVCVTVLLYTYYEWHSLRKSWFVNIRRSNLIVLLTYMHVLAYTESSEVITAARSQW